MPWKVLEPLGKWGMTFQDGVTGPELSLHVPLPMGSSQRHLLVASREPSTAIPKSTKHCRGKAWPWAPRFPLPCSSPGRLFHSLRGTPGRHLTGLLATFVHDTPSSLDSYGAESGRTAHEFICYEEETPSSIQPQVAARPAKGQSMGRQAPQRQAPLMSLQEKAPNRMFALVE